jgi:hypothetical protein
MHFVTAAKFARVGNSAKALEASRDLVSFVRASSALVEKGLALEPGEDVVTKVFDGMLLHFILLILYLYCTLLCELLLLALLLLGSLAVAATVNGVVNCYGYQCCYC